MWTHPGALIVDFDYVQPSFPAARSRTARSPMPFLDRGGRTPGRHPSPPSVTVFRGFRAEWTGPFARWDGRLAAAAARRTGGGGRRHQTSSHILSVVVQPRATR